MDHNFSRDVEWICEENNARRKWAEEVEEKGCCAGRDVEIATSGASLPPAQHAPSGCRNDSLVKTIRTAALACAMAAGGGAAFAGMGMAMSHGATIFVGVIIAVIFGGFGVKLEGMME